MSKSSGDSGKAVAKVKQTGLFAGVENPAGAAFAGFALAYVLMPMGVVMITKPGGAVQSVVEMTWKTLLPGANGVPKDRVIPALATIYATFAYGISGAFSVAGSAMGRKESHDLEHPRTHVHQLRGLPQRLKAAHDHLMEAFPMWGIAAALAQVLAPKNPQVINILGLGMLLKLFMHYPAYLLNVPPFRSLAHLGATAAATAALYVLATGAR